MPQFKEETGKSYRQVVIHTQKARDMIARFVIRRKIADIEDLKAFEVIVTQQMNNQDGKENYRL